MLNSIRTKVSLNRKRYIENDVNLDLSYVTPNIIAMSYPSEGIESLYRNSYIQVKKFLTSKHTGHYKVYNLRSEKQYQDSKFEQVANYPFLDHQAPPFTTMIDFCKDATAFLHKDPANVVVVHCKAGKGRTGTMIAALLLELGKARDAEEAIAIYGQQRTDDAKGVTIPSQLRYVKYYDTMLKQHIEYKSTTIHLLQFTLHNIHLSLFEFKVMDKQNSIVYQQRSDKLDISQSRDTLLINTKDVSALTEDVYMVIEVKGETVCSFWLNAFFVSTLYENVVTLNKSEIDHAYHNKAIPNDFAVTLLFSK